MTAQAHQSTTGSGIHVVNGCLIVPVAGESDEDALKRMGENILACLKTFRPRGVLINMSAVPILGSYGFSILRNTARAVAMMGSRAVFVGFRPGVASALVDLETDFTGILTAVTTEDAFELLGPGTVENRPEEPDGEGEEAGEDGEEPDHGS